MYIGKGGSTRKRWKICPLCKELYYITRADHLRKVHPSNSITSPSKVYQSTEANPSVVPGGQSESKRRKH